MIMMMRMMMPTMASTPAIKRSVHHRLLCCALLLSAFLSASLAAGFVPSSYRPRSLVKTNKLLPTVMTTTTTTSLFENTNDNVNRESTSKETLGKSGYTTDGYNRFLRKRFSDRMMEVEERRRDLQEDGWGDLFDKRRPIWRKLLKFPFRVAKKVLQATKEPGTLILVRHGESEWNANKTFTGWADPDLSTQGYREVEYAARLLLEGGYEVDVVFTSRLKRAIRSVWVILHELNQVYLPVFKSWRLNERMYGALTGLSKKETAEELGTELVQKWRNSFEVKPPALTPSDVHWPGRERKYFDLEMNQIPLTESLQDCMGRTEPVWRNKIMMELQSGRNVMVVAHANTLRGLIKIIDGISDEDIQEVAIPTGIPVIYKFNDSMTPIRPEGNRQAASQTHMSGVFLEKPGLLKEALKREEEWANQVPGYDSTMAKNNRYMTSLERSLFKLKAERELGKWAGQFVDPNATEDDGNDGNGGMPIILSEDEVWDMGLEGEDLDPAETIMDTSLFSPSIINSSPCVASMPSESVLPGQGDVRIRKDAVIVIIRHGKTEHNKLKLFTGWFDAPLAPEGIEEAKEAGRLLKIHGFQFDVVYTSWLSRAIETAWYVMDEMDDIWLPIIKSWRLNERMYGSLTGLSKYMVAQRHGEKQFKAWRRGYKIRPPPVSSFSQHYPGNDNRYLKYLKDVRYSVRESVIRSIENGRMRLFRKLPKSESLKDCMDRTIPYFTERIVPEAIEKDKRVLISSSENAIRGLLMHLCEIPEEKITELEIPNGLPLIFDIKSRCLKLLDDGTGRDPLEVHNFGNAASYLFRPCMNEDGSPDKECDISYSGDNNDKSQKEEEEVQAIAAMKRGVAGIGK